MTGKLKSALRHTVQHSRQGIVAAESRSDSPQGTAPKAQAVSRYRNLTLVCRYMWEGKLCCEQASFHATARGEKVGEQVEV